MKTTTIAGKLLAITLMLGMSQAVFSAPGKKGPPDPKPVPCDLTDKVAHDHVCRLELLTVFHTIGGADSVNDRDKSSLQSKVCAADDKFEVDKIDDAVQKLYDIVDTVNTKRKIHPTDAAEIAGEAMSAADDIANGNCRVADAP